jgi:hypothetical protein
MAYNHSSASFVLNKTMQGVEVPGGVPCGRGRLEFPWGDVYAGEVQGGRPEVAARVCLHDLPSGFVVHVC